MKNILNYFIFDVLPVLLVTIKAKKGERYDNPMSGGRLEEKIFNPGG
jgi:hypothetical protein